MLDDIQHNDESKEDTEEQEQKPGAAESEADSGNEVAKPVTIVEGLGGAFIEIAEADDGGWHWCLWSTNSRIVARSGDAHNSFKACLQSLRSTVKLWTQKIPIVRGYRRG